MCKQDFDLSVLTGNSVDLEIVQYQSPRLCFVSLTATGSTFVQLIGSPSLLLASTSHRLQSFSFCLLDDNCRDGALHMLLPAKSQQGSRPLFS